MDFDTYQAQAIRTKVYPKDVEIIYPALGLAGEAGEVANKVKKIYRTMDTTQHPTPDQIGEEIGDVLWYAAVLADDLGLDLQVLAERNIRKLMDRAGKDTISTLARTDEQ